MDITGLYRGPLEDFIARRAALERALRPADPAAAAVVAKIRKPTASVWAIDQLAVDAPDLVADLLAAGADALLAQQAVAAGTATAEALLTASARLRDRVEASVRAAANVLVGADHAASEDALRRIRTTLHASSTGSADQRMALWRGSLDRDLESAGFGALPGDDGDAPELAAVLAPLRHAPSGQPASSRPVRTRPTVDLVARRAAERAAADQQAIAQRARAIADSRRQQAERLAADARVAEREAEDAERAALSAEDAAAAARRAVGGPGQRGDR